MTHTKATFGIYRSTEEVKAAVSLLSRVGFGNARASILYPNRAGSQDFPQVQKNEVLKFARIGSAIGAGLFFIFASLAVSDFVSFIHLSQLSSTGRVLTVVAALFLGAVIGAACGTLVGIGTPERAGRRYGQYVDAGGILLSVHSETPETQKRIEEIFEKSGAQDITSVDEARGWSEVTEETTTLDRVNLSPQAGQESWPLS